MTVINYSSGSQQAKMLSIFVTSLRTVWVAPCAQLQFAIAICALH